MKKNILYVIIIIVLIILGVIIGKNMVTHNKNEVVSSNKIEDKNLEKDKNTVKNEKINTEENAIINTIENTTIEETEEPKTALEKAIEILKKEWGEDDTVYFAEDGQTENGDYIICVRDNQTTEALAWYLVNIKEGPAEKWE